MAITLAEARQQLLALDGIIATAVVDYTSGMTVSATEVRPYDIELASAVATEVVRAKLRAIEQMGGGQSIDDILVTLSDELHLITLNDDPGYAGMFAYMVLDRARGNLALARRRLRELTAIGVQIQQ